MIKLLKIVFIVIFTGIIIVAVGNMFFGFLDELMRILSLVPSWAWFIITPAILFVFIKKDESGKQLSANSEKKFSSTKTKTQKISRQEINEEKAKKKKKSLQREINKRKREDESLKQQKLQQEEVKKAEEHLRTLRKAYGKYSRTKNTRYLKHPKYNLIIPDELEKLKSAYFGYTLLSEKDFDDWLEGDSFNHIEDGPYRIAKENEETISIMKDAYKNDIEITDNTIFLEPYWGGEIMPIEIDEVSLEYNYQRIVTREKFERWVNS